MESITKNVAELDAPDRSALERMVGHPLNETHGVVVNIFSIRPNTPTPRATTDKAVPDHWKVYEGLDDERIEELSAAITQRADLTRSFE